MQFLKIGTTGHGYVSMAHTCPNSSLFHYFHLKLTFESIKELENASFEFTVESIKELGGA